MGKKTIKILIISLSSLIIVLFSAIIFILSDRNLTNLVNKHASAFVDANVSVAKVSASFFNDFPCLSIKLDNGVITNKNTAANKGNNIKDTLLTFKNLSATLNIAKLISGKISIDKVIIERPKVAYFNYQNNTSNWDIFTSSSTDKQSKSSSQEINLEIGQIKLLQGGEISYKSLTDSLESKIAYSQITIDDLKINNNTKISIADSKFYNLSLSALDYSNKQDKLGERAKLFIDSLCLLSKQNNTYELNLHSNVSISKNNKYILDKLFLYIKGNIGLKDSSINNIAFNGLRVQIGKMPIDLNGKISISEQSICTNNLTAEIYNYQLSHLLKIMTALIPDYAKNIETDAIVNLKICANGKYISSKNELPIISAHLIVPKCHINNIRKNAKINSFKLDSYAKYDHSTSDSIYLKINDLTINSRALNLKGKGNIKNLLQDPLIAASFNGNADLAKLSKLFPSKHGTNGIGKLIANLKISSKLSNLNLVNIGRANINGSIELKDININYPPQNASITLGNGLFRFASMANKIDTTIKMGTRMLTLTAKIDTISLRKDNEFLATGAQIWIAGHNAASILSGDSTTVHPLNGVLNAKYFHTESIDSSRITARDSKNSFSILAYNGDYKHPIIKLMSENKRLWIRSLNSRYAFKDLNLSFEGIKLRNYDDRQIRRKTRLDSLAKIYPNIPRDSLLAHNRKINSQRDSSLQDDFKAKDLDLKVGRNYASLLRNWNFKGRLLSSSSIIRSPYFPISTAIYDLDADYNENDFYLVNTSIKAGQSQMTINGQLTGIEDIMLGRGGLKLNLGIQSDTLNFNELVQAANEGSKFELISEKEKDKLRKLSDAKLEKKIGIETKNEMEKMQLFVIPSNVEASITLDSKYGVYSSLHLSKLSGNLLVKDRCLQLNNIETITDAGSVALTAYYATKSQKDLSCGFDMEMKNMAVERLLDLVPAVDTILPMVRSFEGLLNCQIAATSGLDTSMNFVIESMRGIARLKGKKMVLLDGETFTEISKKLMFKNKKRNLIDSISVEVLLKDKKLEIFPFLMEIDRYKTAISGEQNLDMSFKYHISVLKSPLPIRLGVDIFGTIDNFKYRIGRAKYKSTKLPVFSHLIDNTRLNLKAYISNIYKKGIEEIINHNLSVSELEKANKENKKVLDSNIENLSTIEELLILSGSKENEKKSVPPTPAK